MRDYLRFGGAMGWTPDEVRQTSFSDFAAATEGYLLSQGAEIDDGPSEEDVKELDALMEAYPDG